MSKIVRFKTNDWLFARYFLQLWLYYLSIVITSHLLILLISTFSYFYYPTKVSGIKQSKTEINNQIKSVTNYDCRLLISLKDCQRLRSQVQDYIFYTFQRNSSIALKYLFFKKVNNNLIKKRWVIPIKCMPAIFEENYSTIFHFYEGIEKTYRNHLIIFSPN